MTKEKATIYFTLGLLIIIITVLSFIYKPVVVIIIFIIVLITISLTFGSLLYLVSWCLSKIEKHEEDN